MSTALANNQINISLVFDQKLATHYLQSKGWIALDDGQSVTHPERYRGQWMSQATALEVEARGFLVSNLPPIFIVS